ncbi:LysR family transcriptional regulator [Amorphus orientalis]|uniref:DNA-binding transcriptional LysR family regulator n=1 Tax=Amorphus orientalis TaxID=649198 RepID=A0AAE4AQC3_9HYPH|nr:LysR family transcriptional regulator [Amorphus orientalis]MDQ0313916.1 DNA-binding transcriptional LysR family regulator [Amorphus orientalis]
MVDVNRSAEMQVFVRVVENGGFAAAGRVSGMTASAVSKLVGRLENRLGARLVHRSTRKMAVTPEGAAFYERAVRILADIAEAERMAGAGEAAAGRVRLSTSASYANAVLFPILPEFLAAYPDVVVDVGVTDDLVDLVEHRVDVAVRAGRLAESRLIARRLGATRMVIVAAPGYLETVSIPSHPNDLRNHNLLGLCKDGTVLPWPFQVDGERVELPVRGNAVTGNGDGLRRLAIAGAGLARLARFTVQTDIAEGRLVPVLEEAVTGDELIFHAVYLGQQAPLPGRVRALLDFLFAHGRIPDPEA